MLLVACGGKDKDGATSVKKPQQRPVAVDDSLHARLVRFGQQPRPQGKFAFYVYDLTADRPVYGLNERQALPSASCLKLLTGVAGLHLLGNNYMYRSEIFARGRISGGTLEGDVSFRPGLDPQLMGPDLTMFAKAVRQAGITKIGGRLVADLTITEPVESEAHWYPWDLAYSHYGLLYKGADRVMRELKAAMRGQGIAVADSQVVIGTTPPASRCLYRYYRPISLVTERMWRHSSNTQATAMLYTIGHRARPKADPVLAGLDYLKTFMRDTLGLRDTSLVIHDGCGLCTYNHLSPVALTAILRFGYHHKPIYQRLLNDLSLAGVNGTLRREMAGPKLRGKVRAKTGTLSHPYGISSLAGYCQGANGHTLAFAIMDSEMSVLDARVLQRKLCEALVKP